MGRGRDTVSLARTCRVEAGQYRHEGSIQYLLLLCVFEGFQELR